VAFRASDGLKRRSGREKHAAEAPWAHRLARLSESDLAQRPGQGGLRTADRNDAVARRFSRSNVALGKYSAIQSN
jgi:hypothetical protein